MRNENETMTVLNDNNISKNIKIVDLRVNQNGGELTGFEAILDNNSETDYEYGYRYHLEVYQKEQWYVYKSEEKDSFIFKMIAFPLPAGERRTGVYDFLYQQSLASGQYRFVTEVIPKDMINTEYVWYEFEIE